jgi:Anti-sigma-K factor rskA
MSHVSDDVLAAIALGDPDVDPADREHAESCPVCSEELSELRQVSAMLRDEVGMRDAHRVDPGPQVWERVLAATSGEAIVQAGGESARPTPTAVPDAPVGPAAPVAARASEAAQAEVTPMETRRAARAGQRSTRPWWLVATAAACLLLGVLVGRAVWAPGDVSSPVVASVPLTTLDTTKQQEGTAELLGGQGGQGQELRVETKPMSAGSGFVEVWLINTDGKRMVSLGVLSGDQATFQVPADAIAQGYTIVDLSVEQYDDKPQHSGDSIMRGTLPV